MLTSLKVKPLKYLRGGYDMCKDYGEACKTCNHFVYLNQIENLMEQEEVNKPVGKLKEMAQGDYLIEHAKSILTLILTTDIRFEEAVNLKRDCLRNYDEITGNYMVLVPCLKKWFGMPEYRDIPINSYAHAEIKKAMERTEHLLNDAGEIGDYVFIKKSKIGTIERVTFNWFCLQASKLIESFGREEKVYGLQKLRHAYMISRCKNSEIRFNPLIFE